MRNIQLGSFGVFFALLGAAGKDGAEIASRGFFSGYGPMVWLCISLHSLGGLAVAMVIKYADNVVRWQSPYSVARLRCPASLGSCCHAMSMAFLTRRYVYIM